MAHNIETTAWAGETPWHGLGVDVTKTPIVKRTPEFMIKKGGLDWKVAKRPLSFASSNGKGQIIVPDRYALVRDKDERPLSIVGGNYKPVQNTVSMDFFCKFIKAGHMSLETVGSLYSGQYIWVLARIGADFKLGKDDEVRGFLLLCNPHVFGKALIIQFTPIRVVCWNTLTWALGAEIKGSGIGSRFAMPHSVEFDDVVRKKAEIALGLAKEQMDDFKQASLLLSKAKAKPDEVEEFFCDVLRFEPAEAKRKKGKKKQPEMIEPRMLPKFRAALTNEKAGALMSSAEGTWWGALNAVTFVADHQTGRDESTNLRSSWLGTRAALKRRATELAIERAK